MDYRKLLAILDCSPRFFHIPPDVDKICIGDLSSEVRAGECIYSSTIDNCKPGIWRTFFRDVPPSHHDPRRYPDKWEASKWEIVLWWVDDGLIKLDNVVPEEWNIEQKQLDGQYPAGSLDRKKYKWRRRHEILFSDGGRIGMIAMLYFLDDTKRQICGAVKDDDDSQAIEGMELYLEALNLCGNDIDTPKDKYGYTLGGSSSKFFPVYSLLFWSLYTDI
jgi:hypothetical protein